VIDLKNIKAILFDIDGVLTDGAITIDSNGEELKTFNVRDGQLIQFMQSHGFVFGAISGRKSKSLIARLEELGIDFYRLGESNKVTCLKEFLNKFNLNSTEVGYVGDDVIDIEVLKSVEFSFAPADASHHVLKVAKIVTNSKGGAGVLREIIESIIVSNPKLSSVFNSKFKI
jgi:3-deoxy-D-manno-octulosonate 8-phosphate phosphatase (KDO 8-P phosphatase)